MKIGIIGVGHIGTTLSQKLAAAGHDVKVANSRGPETIGAEVLETGARAVPATEAVTDVDVVILSVPLNRVPDIAPIVGEASPTTVVIDTSNYYPTRDSQIRAIEDGQVESLWVAERLGRPVVKAWNAIGSGSLANKGMPAGRPGRIAIPVAADDPRSRAVGIALVEDTGFDGVDAGTLDQSWRQQPGAPAYCTDLTSAEVPAALAAADAARSPKRRDIAMAAIAERFGADGTNPDEDYGVRLSRVLYT
ncbi:NADPH-dependent F420 reductase [Mycolicibacterium sediminis]|uniref:3-hydroxyisobutyrate dehydrogenase n=1 Tax=Mycolicibacterium sediminis TaxID=1286180 RepID=A0A7I7QR64_9MYCO|nr:NAD(P)-binding domain-containing protein [Mycolicibacterium sediminis]BBY28775.1 3-hydroxyisobutyrate dehydrogenase [Mycolicibacterium sediminis]